MSTEAALAIVHTAVGSEDEARRLASAIIEARLAACVQVTPIHSVYRWKGQVESGPEFLLAAKTRADRTDALMAFVRERHSYEVPEIIETPIHAAWGPYADWVAAETGSGE